MNQRLANFVERSPRSVRPMRAPRSRLGSREFSSQFSKREQPGSDARYKKFAKSHEHPSSIANHSRGLCWICRVRFRGPLRTRKQWLARILYGLTFLDYEPVVRGANWVFSELSLTYESVPPRKRPAHSWHG